MNSMPVGHQGWNSRQWLGWQFEEMGVRFLLLDNSEELEDCSKLGLGHTLQEEVHSLLAEEHSDLVVEDSMVQMAELGELEVHRHRRDYILNLLLPSKDTLLHFYSNIPLRFSSNPL